MLFFYHPPPPTVSFHREVAPILAMHCNSCHGEAGGLNTRTYAALMAGGNIGKVVIAGNGEGSFLVQAISEHRAKSRRMPLGSAPLPAAAVETIRRWIDQGATPDKALAPNRLLAVSRRLPQGSVLRVACKVPVEAYLILRVLQPKSRRVLYERVGAVKPDALEHDAGRPKESIKWDVRPEPGWPEQLDVEVSLHYARGAVDAAQLDATVEKLLPR